MKSSKLLSNYQHDLYKAKTSPLLIELNKHEIDSISCAFTTSSSANIPFAIAKQIFDHGLNENSTNLIFIDGNKCDDNERLWLLEALLNQLSDELKIIKNIATLKETLKAGISVATGGLLTEFASSYLDKGIDFIFDEISDTFSEQFAEIASSGIDTISDKVLENIEGYIQDSSGDALGNIFDSDNKYELYLSHKSKEELNTLSNEFSSSGKHSVFQITFKTLLALGLSAPKVIYINNPHKLDHNSLALVSLMLAYAKHEKENERHMGISCVFAYTDSNFQPYCDVPDNLKQTQRLLDEQRRFAQRYSMLERPNSDIPQMAIKPSLFIGRESELSTLQEQFNNRDKLSMSVISGEPGVGKTALVNQLITHIQKQQQVITLTLLNESGYTSTNTGLSSLEKSIIEEANRLEMLSGWKDKSVNFFKNIGSKDNAVKVIGSIFSGADKLISIGEKGYDRLMIDEHIDSIKRSGHGELDNKRQKDKQRHFEKLDLAINTLQDILISPLPIVLFIDDLQWIDNHTSEYILTHLAKKQDLFIVATIRPSDAATIAKKRRQEKELYKYSQSLLKVCRIDGYEKIQSCNELESIQSHVIALSGFNKETLLQLIKTVIKGKHNSLHQVCDNIFNMLGGDKNGDINSLYAIETINVLCDPRLYTNNAERLILDTPLRINPEIKDISSAIGSTFDRLNKKYQSALSHYNQHQEINKYSLTAYAVLEERLDLIKQYFAEYGNTAINTLLLATLLGTPFSSHLVQKVMAWLINNQDPTLAPLKEYLLKGEHQTSLLPEQYAILEEVYDILRRLPSVHDQYHYSHNLLLIFLERQLDHLLQTIFPEDTTNKIDTLLGYLFKKVGLTMQALPYYIKSSDGLTLEESLAIQGYYSVHVSLSHLGYKISPQNWVNNYTSSLNNLAISFKHLGKIDNAIELEKKALQIREKYYQHDPKQWAKLYTTSLTHLANSLKALGRVEHAIELEERALNIREEYYQHNPEPWVADYSISLSNLAYSYKDIGKIDKAIQLEKQVLSIREPYFLQAPNQWAESYTSGLNNLAHSYYKLNRIDDAIPLFEKALSIIEEYFKNNPDPWADNYTLGLHNLAHAYTCVNNIDTAIELKQKAVHIIKRYFQQNPERWVNEYSSSLNRLANSFKIINKIDEAIELEKKALAILSPYYKQSPELWAKSYTLTLNNLANSYKRIDNIDEAIVLEEEALHIRKFYYQQSPELWLEDYTASLNNLAYSYYQLKKLDNAMALFEKVLKIHALSYQQDPQLWAKSYTLSLSNLASLYQRVGKNDQAIELKHNALNIIQKQFQLTPDMWVEDYTTSLNNLAHSYFNSNKIDEAIELEKQALDIIEKYYLRAPKRWAQDYASYLNNLAYLYRQIHKEDEAIALERKALEIKENNL